jgi:UDP-glucose:(heptosyl)LPS alpha-1,3-glucosyltransferase
VIDSVTRAFVVASAGNRCEYCQLPQAGYEATFNIDHIIASQHRLDDDPSNLALCCPKCNRKKGPNLTGSSHRTNRARVLWPSQPSAKSRACHAGEDSLFRTSPSQSILRGLNIALVILHADPARGGAERYTIDLAAALRKRGHRVSLLASSFAPGTQTPEDVHLSSDARTRDGRYLRFLDRLDRHLAATRHDIVHAMLPVRRCDIYHPHAGIAAAALARGHLKYEGAFLQTVSRVATRLNRRRQRFAEVERTLLTGKRPPIVLCLSDYVKRSLGEHYTLADSQLATLFNAVDLARFDPAARPDAGSVERQRLGIAPDQIVALLLANDFERKGLREAIAAAAKVRDPRLTLLVAGRQSSKPYRALAAKEGVERIVFAGATNDPAALYQAADFFLLPTRHDPCSLVVLEALAMGLPVISTIQNGACEIMTDGREGFVLRDPTDIVTLADTMRKMLDENARLAMSAACAELRPRLAYDRHLDTLEAIYRGAAAAENRI